MTPKERIEQLEHANTDLEATLHEVRIRLVWARMLADRRIARSKNPKSPFKGLVESIAAIDERLLNVTRSDYINRLMRIAVFKDQNVQELCAMLRDSVTVLKATGASDESLAPAYALLKKAQPLS